MDGIVTGITSVIPIVPDNSIITDKSGVNGPPVEIMPLPQNSFMSEDATAQLLNNPYKLSLNNNGNSGGTQGGGAGTSEKPATDNMPGEAYNLTLGTKDVLQPERETALDIARMQSYEMLGKSAARQTYRLNPETGAAEAATEKASSVIREKVRSLLSQSAALQNEAPPLPEAQSGPAAPPDARQDRALKPGALRLTASDLEVFTTLDSDLQEALLNMLSGEKILPSDDPIPAQTRPAAGDGSETQGTGTARDQTAGRTGNLIAGLPDHLTIDSSAATEGSAITNMLRQSPLHGGAADAARPAILPDEQALFAAAVMTSERTRGVLPAYALEGSMENLRKITELPYALYIFGNVTAERHRETEEEDGLKISEETEHIGSRPKEFLRLSDAVKMAAVLHNIYYGGSGRFKQEKPWYAAYVRYALKNGIIQNGEFEDLNEFATRAETAYIFSNCVPRAELTTVNHIAEVPDVIENTGYGDRIYLLLRAGVLSISDNKGFFYPEKMMTKTEAAMIIGRIATPSDRKRNIG